MENWTAENLQMFIMLFMPGFVSLVIYDLLVAGEKRDFSQSLFQVIGFSFLNYAALFWLIMIIKQPNFYTMHPVWYFISKFSIMLILPVLWPIIFLKLFSLKFFSNRLIHPIKCAWDFIFNKRESFWVIVHLKNGKRIGGMYADKSFTSSYPVKEQIYLEQVWELGENGDFKNPIARSRGILIEGEEIMSVEFFK